MSQKTNPNINKNSKEIYEIEISSTTQSIKVELLKTYIWKEFCKKYEDEFLNYHEPY